MFFSHFSIVSQKSWNLTSGRKIRKNGTFDGKTEFYDIVIRCPLSAKCGFIGGGVENTPPTGVDCLEPLGVGLITSSIFGSF